MYEHDIYYNELNYYGVSFDPLLDFYSKQHLKGSLLDIGCGQGRDAIPLAQMGYDVTGIDISVTGTVQMLDAARRRNLKITVIHGDYFVYIFNKKYNHILFDLSLYFEDGLLAKELMLLSKAGNSVNKGGSICICMWPSKKNAELVRQLFKGHKGNWQFESKVFSRNIKSNDKIDSFDYQMILLRRFGHV